MMVNNTIYLLLDLFCNFEPIWVKPLHGPILIFEGRFGMFEEKLHRSAVT